MRTLFILGKHYANAATYTSSQENVRLNVLFGNEHTARDRSVNSPKSPPATQKLAALYRCSDARSHCPSHSVLAPPSFSLLPSSA